MGSVPLRVDGVGMAFGAMIVWLIGNLMGVFGGATLLQSLRCGDTPTEVSCATLGTSGPPGSRYVTLTDFSARWEGSLPWMDNETGRSLYVLVPLGDRDESPAKVIAKVYRPENEQAVYEAILRPAMTGMIENRGIDGRPCLHLANRNPGLDPTQCWVFTPDKKPYDARWMGLAFLGGIVLHTASLCLFASPRPQGQASMALPMMSPLLTLVDGLHALANWLPISRRTWGMLILPPAAALAAYALWLYVRLATGSTLATDADDLLVSFMVVLGSSFSLLGVFFLLTPPAADLEPAPNNIPPGADADWRTRF